MRKKTVEEYLELIYDLEEKQGLAQTGTIAAEMDVKPPSVTEMLRKLDKEGFVNYKSYSGATLTPHGRKIAGKLMKKHRIIEDFLIMIGIDEKQSEIDACQIEHHMSEKSIRQLENFVEFLKNDPGEMKCLEQFRKYNNRSDGTK